MNSIAGYSNRLTTTYRFVRDSERLVAQGAKTFGSSFRLNTIFGDMLVVSDPEDIKVLYTANARTYEPLFNGILEPLLGPNSLFLQNGDIHKDRRTTLSSLLRYQEISAHAKTIEEVAIREVSALPVGKVFDMQRVMRAVVIEVMVRFVFGEMEPDRLARYVKLGAALEEKGTPAVFFLLRLRPYLLGMGPWRSFEAIRRELDAMVVEDITRRRNSPGAHHDFLSKLIQAPCHGVKDMSNDELRDQIMTIILAGYGTTALSLAWGFFWLHHFPSALEQLKSELRGAPTSSKPEELHALPYLEASVKETLRISPVVNLAPIRLKESMTLSGRTLPPESIVAVSIWMAHHRPETFDEPDQFRPERFLENRFSPFEYLPFGGGSRRCIGAGFADFEMKLILGRLIERFDFELLRDTVPEPVNRHLFVSPDGGVPMALRKK
jgi:cytochrome P450 family 110